MLCACGFEEAVKDPQFLTDAQKESLKNADEVVNKLGNPYITHEDAMQTINQQYQYDRKVSSHVK